MEAKLPIDKILNSSILATSLFITSGCYKTYKDYKNATPEYKDKFLVKDCIVLSGAAIGILANQACAKKIKNSNSYNKTISNISEKINCAKLHNGIKSSLQYTTDIVKDLFTSFMYTASGIFGALGADYLLSKTDFEQPIYSNTAAKKNKIAIYIDNNMDKITDENTRDILYSSITEMPKMKFLSSGMIGADAIEISKNKEFDKKLKHTTGYLVKDTLIPLLLLSTSSTLTKKVKTIFRIPIIFCTLFGGMLLTRKILERHIKNKNTL